MLILCCLIAFVFNLNENSSKLLVTVLLRIQRRTNKRLNIFWTEPCCAGDRVGWRCDDAAEQTVRLSPDRAETKTEPVDGQMPVSQLSGLTLFIFRFGRKLPAGCCDWKPPHFSNDVLLCNFSGLRSAAIGSDA